MEESFIIQVQPPSVTSPAEVSLFLDFDGTLVEIAPDPQSVEVSGELLHLLAQCSAALGGRLALVSGREAKGLQHLVGEGHKIVGSHGLEYLLKGRIERPRAPAQLLDALDDMRRWADQHAGVLLEEKPLGAALHYRKNPHVSTEVIAFVRGIAERYRLQFQPGSMVAEVRIRGGNKGDAVKRLMSSPPFEGTLPIFIGDDATDEPAFEQAIAMGGMAILVGSRSPTCAQYNLPDIAAVRHWLRQEIVRK